jgi:hypothetical protein
MAKIRHMAIYTDDPAGNKFDISTTGLRPEPANAK